MGHVYWLSASPCPDLTLAPSSQLRCQKRQSCDSAPRCSFTFPAGHHPGKDSHQHGHAAPGTHVAVSPVACRGCTSPSRALLQPPPQPCPSQDNMSPLSSLADVRSHLVSYNPLLSHSHPFAINIQSIRDPRFCKKGNPGTTLQRNAG